MTQHRRGGRWDWLRAYGFFTGGVIGVGVFSLPFVLMRTGLLVFTGYLLFVGALAWWVHTRYLSVVAREPGRHRLPGYVRRRLGGRWHLIVSAAHLLGLFGALVAYIIAGGTFLRLLVGATDLPVSLAMFFYILPGAVVLLLGLRTLPAAELIILGFFLLILLFLPLASLSHLDVARLPLGGDPSLAFLPYGILLFSYWGLSLVPETYELAGRRRRATRAVLAVGLLTAAVAYGVFGVLVASLTGAGTTEDALTGLRLALGSGAVLLVLAFGLLTTGSSYLALGLTLQRTLQLDFRVPRVVAWGLTVVAPYLLVIAGVRHLLPVLALTGAVFLGIEGIAVVAMSWPVHRGRVRKGKSFTRVALAVTVLLLLVGVVGELARLLVF